MIEPKCRFRSRPSGTSCWRYRQSEDEVLTADADDAINFPGEHETP
jgi:hypothetical protein